MADCTAAGNPETGLCHCWMCVGETRLRLYDESWLIHQYTCFCPPPASIPISSIHPEPDGSKEEQLLVMLQQQANEGGGGRKDPLLEALVPTCSP